jgi:hypothetical protein
MGFDTILHHPVKRIPKEIDFIVLLFEARPVGA